MATERLKRHPQWRKAIQVVCNQCKARDIKCLYCLGRGYYFNTQDHNGTIYEKPAEFADVYLTQMYTSGRRQVFLEIAESHEQGRRFRNIERNLY